MNDSPKRLQSMDNIVQTDVVITGNVFDGTRGIIGIAALPKSEFRFVDLLSLLQHVDQSSRRADTHQQHSGGQGIESPRMTHFGGPDKPLHNVDNITGRHAFRLVQIEYAKRRGGSG